MRINLHNAKDLDGLCKYMCSPKEQESRHESGEISIFERPYNNIYDPSELMIKEFQRSSADHKLDDPFEVRPPGVLRKTLLYIEEYVMDLVHYGKDNRFSPPQVPSELEIYNFIWNRTRMIRKDLTLQNYVAGGRSNLIVIDILERIARYHILMQHLLIECKYFVSQQNMEQLGQTLKSLNELYNHDNNYNDCKFEPEFRAYWIICIIDNVLDVLTYYNSLNKRIQMSTEVQYAMDIFMARKNMDYHKMHSLLNSGNLLTLSLIHFYLPNIRSNILQVLVKAHKKLPLDYLKKYLFFDNDDQALEVLEFHGLKQEKQYGKSYIKLSNFQNEENMRSQKKFVPLRKSQTILLKMRGLKRSEICRGMASYEENLVVEPKILELENIERQLLYPNFPPPQDIFNEENTIPIKNTKPFIKNNRKKVKKSPFLKDRYTNVTRKNSVFGTRNNETQINNNDKVTKSKNQFDVTFGKTKTDQLDEDSTNDETVNEIALCEQFKKLGIDDSNDLNNLKKKKCTKTVAAKKKIFGISFKHKNQNITSIKTDKRQKKEIDKINATKENKKIENEDIEKEKEEKKIENQTFLDKQEKNNEIIKSQQAEKERIEREKIKQKEIELEILRVKKEEEKLKTESEDKERCLIEISFMSKEDSNIILIDKLRIENMKLMKEENIFKNQVIKPIIEASRKKRKFLLIKNCFKKWREGIVISKNEMKYCWHVDARDEALPELDPSDICYNFGPTKETKETKNCWHVDARDEALPILYPIDFSFNLEPTKQIRTRFGLLKTVPVSYDEFDEEKKIIAFIKAEEKRSRLIRKKIRLRKKKVRLYNEKIMPELLQRTKDTIGKKRSAELSSVDFEINEKRTLKKKKLYKKTDFISKKSEKEYKNKICKNQMKLRRKRKLEYYNEEVNNMIHFIKIERKKMTLFYNKMDKNIKLGEMMKKDLNIKTNEINWDKPLCYE